MAVTTYHITWWHIVSQPGQEAVRDTVRLLPGLGPSQLLAALPSSAPYFMDHFGDRRAQDRPVWSRHAMPCHAMTTYQGGTLEAATLTVTSSTVELLAVLEQQPYHSSHQALVLDLISILLMGPSQAHQQPTRDRPAVYCSLSLPIPIIG